MVSLGDTLVDRYRLDDALGVGGFAAVYRARDLRLGRDVAVKVLLPQHAADPDVVARFDREARALAAFSHPNVVAIHDVEPADPATGTEPFLVMDLCEGGSLGDQIDQRGGRGLPPDELVPLLLDASAGLGALHAAGMVHRDVKPSNVLLSDGRGLIGDLGIAISESTDATDPAQPMGTLAYQAPEQLHGAPATPASDVHALGVVTFLALTGRLPRRASSMTELVAASADAAPLVSAIAPALGTMFDRPVAAALAVDPAHRPSVEALASRLTRSLERWQEAAAVARTRLPGHGPSDLAAVAIAGGPQPEAPLASDPALVVDPDAASVAFADQPTEIAPALSPTQPLEPVQELGLAASTRPSDPVDPPSSTPRLRPTRWLAAAVVVAGVILIAVLLAQTGPGNAGPTFGPTLAPSQATATASPTATATVLSTPEAPSVAVPPDVFAAALQASASVREAIASAKGRSGLQGHEAKDLERLLATFDQAIVAADGDRAREAAQKLEEAVDDLVDQEEVDDEAGDRLRDAVEALIERAEALQD